ncbi:MAG: P-loop ATPase, Sll1717 family [Terriglobales bacterium]
MPTTRKDALQSLNFGQRVAEEEVRDLAKYFVETEQWRRISSGEIDVVYGPKGSGKSALYALLLERADSFFDRNIVMVSGENPRGATVFKDLVQDPPTSESEFVNLWKLYFLTLVGSILRDYSPRDPSAREVIDALVGAHLLNPSKGLEALLRAVKEYVRRPPTALEGDVKVDPVTGSPIGFGGKITFHEPAAEDAMRGHVSVDSLFERANGALSQLNLTVWILMDRLDVAFAESVSLEANALRALFKVYLDLLGRDHIKLKIFLRTDIWRRITVEQGFREASHITRHITIKWDKPSLMNLAVRRAAQSSQLLDYVSMGRDAVLREGQNLFLEKLLPDQVEVGPNKPKTAFDWILGRTSDGTRENAPRELIHFLNATRDEEIKRVELGNVDAESQTLFSRPAIKNALPEVSKVRLEQTLFAEYPDLRRYVIKLEGEKTLQRLQSLASVWGISEQQTADIAEQLVEVGFFERRGSKEAPEFWVPFIYRPSLTMVQGAAD